MTGIEQAKTVGCPLCGAQAGQQCVTVTDYRGDWRRPARMKGQPIRIAHSQRLAAYRKQHGQRMYPVQPNWRKLYRPSSAVQAVRAYELAEHQALADWLKNGGGLLLIGKP